MRQNTERGAVVIGSNVYTNIAGVAASNCFGVKGMAVRSMTDGLVHLLRKESMSKGVRVQFHEDDTISIDLHIMVDHGVNLAAVGASIISEVRYVVNKCTGTQVRAVNVYIDSMMIG
ncbi:MAG TPA: Asp23/Gls24 family envelope stress response protein [Candidatus Faecousia gallistercoris]|nr:Asp23/Gls24 family envelope stress response protein [Candidatus Faecousia gallistercoris]